MARSRALNAAYPANVALHLPARAMPVRGEGVGNPLMTSVGRHHAGHARGWIYGRGDKIRTCGPLLPKQMRYQAALLPDCVHA